MSSKKLIAEQILTRLSGGYPDVAAATQLRDFYPAIEQKVNSKFRLEHFSVTLESGETIPDSLAVATYENVAVTSYGGVSRSTLPVTPISLPREMGIDEITPVVPTNNNQAKVNVNPFIPLRRSQRFLLSADTLLSDLLGQVGYTPINHTTIEYTKDLVSLGVEAVNMRLVVFEIGNYSETEALPIPSNMIEDIVNELFMQFAPVQPESAIVNPYTTIAQKPNQ
jgi:hypothetical protein